jgi:hypothetical protein
MPKPIHHQIICKGTENGLSYTMPKTINSDIGWQLMFGKIENHKHEKSIIKAHHDKYETKTYSKEDLKLWFL